MPKELSDETLEIISEISLLGNIEPQGTFEQGKKRMQRTLEEMTRKGKDVQYLKELLLNVESRRDAYLYNSKGQYYNQIE